MSGESNWRIVRKLVKRVSDVGRRMAGLQACGESWECKVSAKRMWAGLFEDGHTCLPKALPHLISSVEYPLLHVEHNRLEHLLHFQGHTWCCPGAIRLIKFHPDDNFFKFSEVPPLGKSLHHEGFVLKEEEKKAEEVFHKPSGEVFEKEEEAKVEEKKEVEGFHKLCGLPQEQVKIGKVAIKEEVDKVGKELPSLGKKIDESIETAGESLWKFFKEEELFVKEQIEEVKHEAFKIKFAIIEGFWLKKNFKQLKYSCEFEHKGLEGCIVHWKTEFEPFPECLFNPFEGIKKHYLETIKGVEEYLCVHEDYCHF